MDTPKTQTANTTAFKSFVAEIERRKYWLAAILAVGLASTWIYTAAQPAVYKSTGSLLVEDVPVQQATFPTCFLGNIGPDAGEINAFRAFAESAPVRERACKAARETLGEPPTAAVGDFEAHADGQLIYLQVLDANPKRAAAYANAWSDVIIAEVKDSRKNAAHDPSTNKSEPITGIGSIAALKWEMAVVPTSPYEPNWRRNLFAAFLYSFLFVVLSIVVLNVWKKRRMATSGHGVELVH